MTAIVSTRTQLSGLVLPGLLLVGLTVLVLGQLNVLRLPTPTDPSIAPQTVTVPGHSFVFRQAGDFLRGGQPVDAPRLTISRPPLDVMKFQVSTADYARCATATVCRPAAPRRRVSGNVPVTGVSFDDAVTYARWLSGETGQSWRLPTAEEWAFVAGSREVDHALDAGSNATNPSERWLLAYENETSSIGSGPAAPAVLGSFGLNEFGVADLASTVWEWTSTCVSRSTLGAGGETSSTVESCLIHYLEGRHRAPISDFMRDAQGGGCGGGPPPDNLGFRLVREPR